MEGSRRAKRGQRVNIFNPSRASSLSEILLVRPPRKEQLAASEALIRRGEDDLAAGRTQDMREALLALGEKRGFSLEE